MKSTILVLGVGALITAILAAHYWFRSAMVTPNQFPEPVESVDDVPASHVIVATANIYALQGSLAESALLNRFAARWTAVSALLSAATTFTSLFL